MGNAGTAKEAINKKDEMLETFCENLTAYLTTAGDEKARNMQRMKRNFRNMMDELVSFMFEEKGRNITQAIASKYMTEYANKADEKINTKADAVLAILIRDFETTSKMTLRRAEDIANRADVTKIERIIKNLMDEADASRNKLERSKNEIEKRVDELLRMTPITESIRATFATLKEQGVELSAAEAVEVVKAMAEYQGKIVEKESYGDWAKIQKGR